MYALNISSKPQNYTRKLSHLLNFTVLCYSYCSACICVLSLSICKENIFFQNCGVSINVCVLVCVKFVSTYFANKKLTFYIGCTSKLTFLSIVDCCLLTEFYKRIFLQIMAELINRIERGLIHMNF